MSDNFASRNCPCPRARPCLRRVRLPVRLIARCAQASRRQTGRGRQGIGKGVLRRVTAGKMGRNDKTPRGSPVGVLR